MIRTRWNINIWAWNSYKNLLETSNSNIYVCIHAHTYTHTHTFTHTHIHTHPFLFQVIQEIFRVENLIVFLVAPKFLTWNICTTKVVSHRYAAYVKMPGILSGGFWLRWVWTDCIVTVVMILYQEILCGIIRGHGICNLQKRQEKRNLTFRKLSKKGSIENNT